MPIKDPVKSLEYVQKSQDKEKAEIGVEASESIHSHAHSTYRDTILDAMRLEEIQTTSQLHEGRNGGKKPKSYRRRRIIGKVFHLHSSTLTSSFLL